jgi:hypothetical protein
MTVEYGRKPYLSRSHGEMMRRITDKQINDQKLLHQSEMKKPYMNDTYQEMEHFYTQPWEPGPYPTWPEPPAPDVQPIITPPVDPGIKILCANVAVKYTTKGVNVGETLTLSVEGVSIALRQVYIDWSLSGPGSLSETWNSYSTIYTAPESITGCDNQAIVTVSCNGFLNQKIKITITNPDASPGTYAYWKVYQCVDTTVGPPCSFNHPGTYVRRACSYWWYYCDGSRYMLGGGDVGNCIYSQNCVEPISLTCDADNEVGYVKDLRTAAMIANGCCPADLY